MEIPSDPGKIPDDQRSVVAAKPEEVQSVELIRSAAISSSRRYYRPELDALRFLAFLLVLIKHSWPDTKGRGLFADVFSSVKHAGAFGVPLFFLLSAFLITELLMRERAATGHIHIRAFYIRRILRIWPLYFVVLFAAFLYGRTHSRFQISWPELGAYLFLVGNWWAVFNDFIPGFATPLWSISVEEQFYLLWPTLLRFANRVLVIWLSLLIWTLCQISLLRLAIRGVSMSPQIWASSLVQFRFFALGALLSAALHKKNLELVL